MKLPFRAPKKKKLQAATARRARDADFTEESDVNIVKALVVMLVLHLVGVGGILAFNATKVHQSSTYEDSDAQQTAPAQAGTTAATATQPSAMSQTVATPAAPSPTLYYKVKSGDTIAKIASSYSVGAQGVIDLNNLKEAGGIHVGQSLKMPASAVAPASDDSNSAPKPMATPVRDSGATYLVKTGDTPVSIAHKLHVVYDDLIKLNKIDDPRHLKIGIKLKVPVKRITITA